MALSTEPIISLTDPTELERIHLEEGLARERMWYGDAPRFQTDEDIKAAIHNGALVPVLDTDDFRKTARFSREVEGFISYVTPGALRMIQEFSQRWRVLLWEEYHVQHLLDVLAATSMARAQVYQDKLVQSGMKLAVPDSTHCTGNAVDFDASGYYRLDAEGNFWSHAHPGRRAGSLAVKAQLEARHGEMPDAPRIAPWYDGQITEAAIRVAEAMHNEGSINLVREYVGTPNETLHMAVNPDY